MDEDKYEKIGIYIPEPKAFWKQRHSLRCWEFNTAWSILSIGSGICHYLSVSEYGTLETALLTIQFLIVFMGAGMPAAIIRFYAEDHKRNDIGHLLGSSIGVVGIAMFVCSLLFLLMPSFFFAKLSDVQAPFTLKILIAVPALVECLTLIAMSIYRAQGKAAKYTLVAIGSALLLILFTLLFVPVLNQGLMGH